MSEGVFRAGDAAGQCLPLSGEGIRPALYFGAVAGHLSRRDLLGELSHLEALRYYRCLVERHARAYRLLFLAQKIIPALPLTWIEGLARLVQRPRWSTAVLQAYWNAVDPEALSALFQTGPKLPAAPAPGKGWRDLPFLRGARTARRRECGA